jgi:predicted nucleotidyltransferase
MTKDNIQNLIQSIKEFGFGSLGLETKDFMNPENVIQLGYEPYRIDLLVEVDGADFEACFERKKIVELDGVEAKFLSLQDLITAKKKAGRLQDLADAEQLEKIRNKNKKEK